MCQVTLTKRFKDVSLGLSFFINNRCFASTELPNAFMRINFVVIGLGKRSLQNQSNLRPDDGKWILRQWKNARYLPLLFSNVQLWCIWKTYTVIGWLIDLVLSSVGLFFLCTYGITSLQLFASGITTQYLMTKRTIQNGIIIQLNLSSVIDWQTFSLTQKITSLKWNKRYLLQVKIYIQKGWNT